MGDQKQLQNFVKQVVLAAKKRQEKQEARDELKKHVSKVKKIAGSKRMKKEDLKAAIKELDARMKQVLEKEGDLMAKANREYRSSQEIKSRINEIEGEIKQLSSKDIELIDMLRKQIRGLEHELRVSETKRAGEVNLSKIKIEEIRNTIQELRERVDKMIETKMAREKRLAELEDNIKKEAKTNRKEFEHVESELSRLQSMENTEEAGFLDKLKAKFHRQPKIEDLLKPEERELFKKPIEEKIRKEKEPMPVMRQRPLVKHDIMFEETKARPGVPKEDKNRPELPSLPKAPLIKPKKSFFQKLADMRGFRKKNRLPKLKEELADVKQDVADLKQPKKSFLDKIKTLFRR